MTYRNNYLSSELPILTDALPIANQGDEIGLYFTILWNRWQHHDAARYYAKNITYAYRQLLRHTDVLDVGKVLIFVDERNAESVTPIFQMTGLLPILRFYRSRESHQETTVLHRTERVLFLNSHEFSQCRYIFSLDDDIWFIANPKRSTYRWTAHNALLDKKAPSFYIFDFPGDVIHRDWYPNRYAEGPIPEAIPAFISENFGYPSLTDIEDFVACCATLFGIRNDTDISARLAAYFQHCGHILYNEELFFDCFLKHFQLPISVPEIPWFDFQRNVADDVGITTYGGADKSLISQEISAQIRRYLIGDP